MSHVKAYTVGGIGSQPGLDNVVAVARGFPIALDHAGSERIKKESPPPKAFQAEGDSKAPAAVAAASTTSLRAEQARAVLITRLLSLMNGKTGVRLQVAEFLKELLNQNVVPALPAADDATALDAVADACKGLGRVAGTSQQLDAALEAAGISPPGISTAERAAVGNGAAASAGVGSLVVVGAKQLLTVVTAIAALSCEAAGAQVSCRGLLLQLLSQQDDYCVDSCLCVSRLQPPQLLSSQSYGWDAALQPTTQVVVHNSS
eukprot:GHRQ01022049.1.p1 GENE.GHRQ01022049.1~~GHRQ01022049.1.p1  ORF type:complete len:261 (+),score=74.95 GHRQ01022049.1:176-958(+)